VTESLEELERRLGVVFRDRGLLERALTHPSFSLERGGDDYERLEFLGDAVLASVIAAYLFEAFPAQPEGMLTRMKVTLTSGRTLATVARELGLGPHVRLGKGALRDADRDSVLENAFEALVGAVYMEAGPVAAEDFVLRCMADRLDGDALLATASDPKSRLQEVTQGLGLGLPEYAITGTTGPAHEPSFTAVVSVGGIAAATGEGASKQAAQQAAALAALRDLERD
jgi:ribonuclease-3